MATPSSSSVLKGSSSNMAPAFDILHPRPDLPPSIAAITLRKLIALNLQTAGFDSTSSEALEELEGIVNTCMLLSHIIASRSTVVLTTRS